MQDGWKQWPQSGKTLTCSPVRNSDRQMVQSVDLPAPASKKPTGRARMAFFLRPLLASTSSLPPLLMPKAAEKAVPAGAARHEAPADEGAEERSKDDHRVRVHCPVRRLAPTSSSRCCRSGQQPPGESRPRDERIRFLFLLLFCTLDGAHLWGETLPAAAGRTRSVDWRRWPAAERGHQLGRGGHPGSATLHPHLPHQLGLHDALRLCRFGISSGSDDYDDVEANKGLKQKTIRAIPVAAFDAGAGKSTDCAICLSEFLTGEQVRVLPLCGHCFHPFCIDTWLSSHSSCPSCRRLLLSRKTAAPSSRPPPLALPPTVRRCQRCGLPENGFQAPAPDAAASVAVRSVDQESITEKMIQ
ncbi:RING-H2 finger protein [Nymphaea thermarum]|nr:RING-H2 finger protein [Nymphaea thermarum]